MLIDVALGSWPEGEKDSRREKTAMYNRRGMPVVYETEAPHAPRSDLGPYREADYLALPDEPRCELLYGRLHLMTAPTVRHQHVVGRLFRLLLDLADRIGGQAVVSPVDVVLAEHSIVQPDVIYVTKERSALLQHARRGDPISSSRCCRRRPPAAISARNCASTPSRASPSTGSSIRASRPSSFSKTPATVSACAYPIARSTDRQSSQASSSTLRLSGAPFRAEAAATPCGEPHRRSARLLPVLVQQLPIAG